MPADLAWRAALVRDGLRLILDEERVRPNALERGMRIAERRLAALLAALSLALRQGYDSVTTEMIAAEAGISQRTFFNYYLNKNAAIIGTAPSFDEATVAWFRNSSGPLLNDLWQALRHLLCNSDLNRETSQLIDRLLDRAPELLPIFYGSLKRLGDQIADLAVTRLGEDSRPDAELLAQCLLLLGVAGREQQVAEGVGMLDPAVVQARVAGDARAARERKQARSEQSARLRSYELLAQALPQS